MWRVFFELGCVIILILIKPGRILRQAYRVGQFCMVHFLFFLFGAHYGKYQRITASTEKNNSTHFFG